MKLGKRDFVKYVNVKQGTDSTHGFSCGNTLPLTGVPFAFVNFCPATSFQPRWFFNSNDRRVSAAIRVTHQPSPWISDYGQLGFMPVSGDLRLDIHQLEGAFGEMTLKPDYLKVTMLTQRASAELAPTEHGCVMRYTYDNPVNAGLDIYNLGGDTYYEFDSEHNLIRGYTTALEGGDVTGKFREYFVLAPDTVLDVAESFVFENNQRTGTETPGKKHTHIRWKTGFSGTVIIKAAFSYISFEQAEYNLSRELPDDFAEVFERAKNDAHELWQSRLSCISVKSDLPKKDAIEDFKTFYTCLYRCFLFPHIMHEETEDGRLLHYSPYDGTIHEGLMYTDHGFWDVAKTTYPLYSIICPDDYANMLQAWLSVYDEYGVMPKWPSPGERAAMPGTLVDSLFGEAAVKGIDFDAKKALAALLSHADSEGPRPGSGRRGGQDYAKYGYLPEDLYRHESVAATLDYMYGDYCIAQVAQLCGDDETASRLLERSHGYAKLFDPEYGILRGLNSDGTRRAGFDPIEWGMEYCEGSAYQCAYSVYHDFEGLRALYGGDNLLRQLSSLETMPSTARNGSYGAEIHEATEMMKNGLGQINIGNQPGFHVPYIFTELGAPEKTQALIRRVMRKLFSYKPDGLPGDDDNGSMTGYFVFSALGFFPLCPAKPEYTLGSPLFRKATIKLPDGGKFKIRTVGNPSETPYVSKYVIDGMPIEGCHLSHFDIRDGSTLTFVMR
jgi:alpha-1,2-mannosidase, putative